MPPTPLTLVTIREDTRGLYVMMCDMEIERRVLFGGFAGSTLLGGCGAAAPAAGPVAASLTNPATERFLAQVAIALGASVLEDALKEGSVGLKKWFEPTMKWITKWHGKSTFWWYSQVFGSTYSPGFLLVRISKKESGNPLRDEVGIILDYGKEAIRLPAWAWQTLVIFSEDFLKNRTGADLAQARALLVAALAPSSSKVKTHATPTGVVATVSYSSKLGPVDILKIEEENHSFSGVIKVAGIPDAALESIVSHYPLPTKVAI